MSILLTKAHYPQSCIHDTPYPVRGIVTNAPTVPNHQLPCRAPSRPPELYRNSPTAITCRASTGSLFGHLRFLKIHPVTSVFPSIQ